MRKKFSKVRMVICADDDHKTEGNIGIKKATETALAVNGLLAVPVFGEARLDHQTDFNDMVLVSGYESLKSVIDGAAPPKQSTASNEDWTTPIPLPKGLPVKEFDYDLLPESLRAWVKDISNRMQCPPDFPAVASIVSASSLIGARAVIRPKEKDSWEVTPNLWGCVVGRAGVMKTPAVKEVLNPLWKLDSKERQNYEVLIADWEHDKYLAELIAKDNATKAKGLASKGEISQAKKLIGDAQIPPKPVGKRHIVNDSTVESLQELMAENCWGFLCFRDELYGLFKSMEKQIEEMEKKLKSAENDPEALIRVLNKNPFAEDLVEIYRKGAGGELNKLRQEANEIRRDSALTPKDKTALLKMNMVEQNIVKHSLVEDFKAYGLKP